jgi:hypothetical protein
MEIPLRRQCGLIPITFAQELRPRETLGTLDGALLCSRGTEAFKVNLQVKRLNSGKQDLGGYVTKGQSGG